MNFIHELIYAIKFYSKKITLKGIMLFAKNIIQFSILILIVMIPEIYPELPDFILSLHSMVVMGIGFGISTRIGAFALGIANDGRKRKSYD